MSKLTVGWSYGCKDVFEPFISIIDEESLDPVTKEYKTVVIVPRSLTSQLVDDLKRARMEMQNNPTNGYARAKESK
jgi:hypothetical protein